MNQVSICKTILLILFCVFLIENSNGQAGTLDSTFSNDGILLYSPGTFNVFSASGIELQSDGKYVISGKAANSVPDESNFLAVRVNTDGSLDSSFGTDGYSAHNTFDRSFAHDLGLQQDGKILLTGQDFDDINILENIGVIRLNTDGSLDNTFGDTGRVDIDHGHNEEGHTIIQLADGKIVLTGHTDYDFVYDTIDGPNKNNVFIARLNADGSNDSTFGINGFTSFDFGGTMDYSKNMILQGDKYIAGSCTCSVGKCHAIFFRVTSAGVIDSTFGTNGVANAPAGVESIFWRMATQADGKIVAVGQIIYNEPAYDLFAQRFFPDGKIDSSFATNGTFSLDLGEPSEKFEDVAIQPDGKIVCAGYSSEGTSNQSIGDAVVVRLNEDGTLDTSFASGGVFEISMVPGFDETKACLIDQQGKIVVTGYAHNTGDSGGRVFVFRLNSGCTSNYVLNASGPLTFCKGQSVTLTVSPSASSYQWKKNGNNINGATSISYLAKAAGSYSCSVSGDCGTSVTNAVNVIVNPNPKAIINPTGTVTMCAGDSIHLKANNNPGLTYQWFKGVTSIAGATTSSYWAKDAGKYRVQTTNANGCTAQSSKTTVQITCRTVESTSSGFFLYPNPSSGKIYVRLADLPDAEAGSFEVYDLSGKAVLVPTPSYTSNEIQLDLTSLPSGIYFLEMKTEKEIVRKMVSIEKE